jgi:hypothetical protein
VTRTRRAQLAIQLILAFAIPPSPSIANNDGFYCRASFNNKAYRLVMKDGEQTVAEIRNDDRSESLTFAPAGALTEEVGPPVGRNGEIGIGYKRVYIDNGGDRWLYSNIDAHISLVSYGNQQVFFSCHP